MKSLRTFILEAKGNYKPKDRDELVEILNKLIDERGVDGDFNDIDTSLVKDMSHIRFDVDKWYEFNGDISKWNVSNVESMNGMFKNCDRFNGDISKWNTKKCRIMQGMFENTDSFNQDISNWDVSNVEQTAYMFQNAKAFNQDLSNWNLKSLVDGAYQMFKYSPMETQRDKWPSFKPMKPAKAKTKRIQKMYGELMKIMLGYTSGNWERYFKGEYDSVLAANEMFSPAFKNEKDAWKYVKEHENEMVKTTAKYDDDWGWTFSVEIDGVTTNFAIENF